MRLTLILASAVLIAASAAQAATFTYDFTATSATRIRSDVTEASLADDVFDLYGPGGTIAEMTGTVTFDDTLISSAGGVFTYSPATITVDGLDLSGLWPRLETRAGGFGVDFIGTLSDISDTTARDALDIILQDTDDTAFAGGPPDFGNLVLAEFETAILLFYNPRRDSMESSNRVSTDRVDLTLTSLSLQPAPVIPPVPLPAGITLLLGGMGLLGALRWRAGAQRRSW